MRNELDVVALCTHSASAFRDLLVTPFANCSGAWSPLALRLRPRLGHRFAANLAHTEPTLVRCVPFKRDKVVINTFFVENWSPNRCGARLLLQLRLSFAISLFNRIQKRASGQKRSVIVRHDGCCALQTQLESDQRLDRIAARILAVDGRYTRCKFAFVSAQVRVHTCNKTSQATNDGFNKFFLLVVRVSRIYVANDKLR